MFAKDGGGARLPRSVAVVAAVLCAGTIASGGTAVAQQCAGTTALQQASAEAGGYCVGESQPGRPGTSTDVRGLWNAYCAPFTRPYVGVHVEPVESTDEFGRVVDTEFVTYTDEVDFLPAWDHPPENANDAQRRGEYAFMVAMGWDPTSVVRHYQVRCTGFEVNWTSGYGYGWVDGGATGDVHFTVVDPVPIETIRDAALAKIQPAEPQVGSAPPTSQAVVNLPTWLWVETPWVELSDWESQGAVRVDVFARPVDVTWRFDDDQVAEFAGAGETVCDDPGQVWTPSDGDADSSCQYTFSYPSSWNADGVFHGSVTVRWEVSWSLNGDDQGTFGDISRTTDFDVSAIEIQTVGVGTP